MNFPCANMPAIGLGSQALFVGDTSVCTKSTPNFAQLYSNTLNTWSYEYALDYNIMGCFLNDGPIAYVVTGGDLVAYNSTTGQWVDLGSGPSGYYLSGRCCAKVGRKLIYADLYTNDRYNIFDTTRKRWGYVSAPTKRSSQSNRYSVGCAGIGPKFFVFGGGNSTIDIYDFDTDRWTLSRFPTDKEYSIQSTSLGTKLFFAGGYTIRGPYNYETGDITIYNLVTGTLSTTQIANVTEPCAVSCGTKSFFAGGFNGSQTTSIVNIYDSETDSWNTDHLSAPRSGMSCVCTSTISTNAITYKVLFVGGKFANGSKSDIVDIFTILPPISPAIPEVPQQIPWYWYVVIIQNAILLVVIVLIAGCMRNPCGKPVYHEHVIS